jgi:hypothetical protein
VKAGSANLAATPAGPKIPAPPPAIKVERTGHTGLRVLGIEKMSGPGASIPGRASSNSRQNSASERGQSTNPPIHQSNNPTIRQSNNPTIQQSNNLSSPAIWCEQCAFS